ncbi:hypothetical protein [Mycobacterium sp.]
MTCAAPVFYAVVGAEVVGQLVVAVSQAGGDRRPAAWKLYGTTRPQR